MVADVHYFSPTTPGAAAFDVDVSSEIRRGRIGPLPGEAQMAAVGSGACVLDDVDSTLGEDSDGILGLKQWYWNETDCPAGNQRVFTGYTFNRQYNRGDSLVQGAARKVDVTLMDPNAFLSFRVFAPADTDPTSSFVRPAETTIERIQALLTEVDFLSTTLFDLGYIPTTGGKPMDAHDYTTQKPFDVVNDIAQVEGWNPWVGYDETENKLFLWFDDWTTDGSATVPYDSTLRLTNVQAEHDADPDVDFLIELNAIETVDPSRVISAVYVMGKGATVYRTRPETAYTFGWRDAVMQAQFLSDPAKLEDLGDRYLLDNSTEDHRITCTVQVPSSKVTAIHEGMRIQLHGTHLPSCADDFTWCRILTRTVRVDVETQQYYWLDLELSPILTPVVVDALGIMYYGATGGSEGTGPAIQFVWTISDGSGGCTPFVTVGPIVEGPEITNAADDIPKTGRSGWIINAQGTVTGRHVGDIGGVAGTAIHTIRLLMNGSVVNTHTFDDVSNPSRGFDYTFTVTAPLSTGNEMTLDYQHNQPGGWAGAPAGVGGCGQYFEITSAELVEP